MELDEIRELLRRVEDFASKPDAANWRITWRILKDDIEVFATNRFAEGKKDYVTIHNAVNPIFVLAEEDWEDLITGDLPDVYEALRLVEHRLEVGNAELREASEAGVLVAAGTPHAAYVLLRELVAGAQRRIWLVDAYMDETIFALLSNAGRAVEIRLLTRKRPRPADFAHEYRLFVEQHSGTCECRTGLEDLHDRYLVIDDRAFHSGASFKDLGRKESLLTEVVGLSEQIISSADSKWKGANVLTG
jgi:hypothetical protein